MTFNAAPAGADDPSGGETVLTDFSKDSADFGWYVLNDNVMGGRSEGGFGLEPGELVFRGRTNTDGGGFSSIRSSDLELDLSGYDGIRLRVQGDGRRYTWRLTTSARDRGRAVAYWAEFDTVGGDWRDVDVPFSAFVPKFRGYRLDGPPLDAGDITGMGLMIYDRRDGPFELRLSQVGAYAERKPFSLGQYRWRHRVLVLSAADADDENLKAQQAALEATPAESAERDLVVVTLLDAGPATAHGQPLSAGDVAATRQALGIPGDTFALRLVGKDGSVKLSGETAIPMDEIYALIDTMPMRRAEQQAGPE